MAPMLPADNVVYGNEMAVKHRAQLNLSDAKTEKSSYFENFCVCENRIRVPLAVTRVKPHSSLPHHIPCVVGCVPKPQMVGPDAHGIVTSGAVMKNIHAVRNRSAMKNPTDAVRDMHPLADSAPNSPVSEFEAFNRMTSPDPAGICESHLAEESLGNGLVESLRFEESGVKIGPRNQVHFGYVTLRAAARRAGALLNYLLEFTLNQALLNGKVL